MVMTFEQEIDAVIGDIGSVEDFNEFSVLLDARVHELLTARNDLVSCMASREPELAISKLHVYDTKRGVCSCGLDAPCPTHEVLFEYYRDMRLAAEATVPEAATVLKVGAL